MSKFLQQVNFNSGEGIDFTDFKNVQQCSWAFRDFEIGVTAKSRMGDDMLIDADYQKFIICENAASGGLTSTATNMRVTNQQGLIYQWTAAPSTADGSSPICLPYMLAPDELLSTVPTAHGSLNRIDALCIKISQISDTSQSRDFKDATTGSVSSQSMNTRFRTKLDISYVTGTPASPALAPTPPSGYAVYAYVYVEFGYTSTFRPQDFNVWDARMPRRLKMGRAFATSVFFNSTNASATAPATLSTNRDYVNFPGTNGSADEAFWPFSMGPYARLLAVGIFNDGSSSYPAHYIATLVRVDETMAASSLGLNQIASSCNLNAYIALNDPVWGNGYKCPLNGEDYNFATKTFLAASLFCNDNAASPVKVSHVDYIYAE